MLKKNYKKKKQSFQFISFIEHILYQSKIAYIYMYIYIRKSCISIDHFGFGIALELKRIVGNLKGL